MSMLNSIVPKSIRTLVEERRGSVHPVQQEEHQRRLMVSSLCLLLLALGIVLWHDRDFWLPDTSEAEVNQPVEPSPVASAKVVRQQAPAAPQKLATNTKARHKSLRSVAKVDTRKAAKPSLQSPPPAAVTATRTVLPPLEVEVVAGDSHRIIRPANNALRVDLHPGAPPEPASEISDSETAATVTSNASEHMHMSPNASAMVASPVKPSYPLLARQMKVQGAVILQALINKDGVIQNLRVLSGPHILASAAQDAVRQWHFKPHFEGSEPVETEAKITVNFTISTN